MLYPWLWQKAPAPIAAALASSGLWRVNLGCLSHGFNLGCPNMPADPGARQAPNAVICGGTGGSRTPATQARR